MKLIKNALYFICFLGMTMQLSAYIYQAKVMRKWDAGRNRYHYVVGFSDFHDKAHESNEQQRTCIEKLLKDLDCHKYKVVVEDLCTKESTDTISSNFYIASKGGILAGLGAFCKEHNIPCENVEYRYNRVATMGPVINNVQSSPHLFLSTRSVTVKALVDEIEQAMHDISARITNATLKKICQQEMRKVRIVLDKLCPKKSYSMSVADYLQSVTNSASNKVDILKHLLTFDTALLDIKMTQEIIACKEKFGVFAFTGGTHIRHTCQLLEKVGYKELKCTALSYKKEHNLDNCVGATIVDGSFCLKPEPLKSDTITHYMQQSIKSR